MTKNETYIPRDVYEKLFQKAFPGTGKSSGKLIYKGYVWKVARTQPSDTDEVKLVRVSKMK